MVRALTSFVVVLLGGAMAPRAWAQTPSGADCGSATLAWMARCNAAHGTAISRVECPAPGLFLFTTPDARVEVHHRAPRSFRQVNGWGLSLVHENDLWERLSAAKRAAFERVQACVTEDASLPTTGPSRDVLRLQRGSPPSRGQRPGDRTGDPTGDPVGDRTGDPTGDPVGDPTGDPVGDRTGDDHRDHAGGASHGRDRVGEVRRHGGSGGHGARWFLPWRLLLAAGLLLGAWGPRVLRGMAKHLLRVGGVALVSLAVLFVRWRVYGPGFFHQNGQGPMWVDSALSAWLPYGPGFHELFNLPARLHPAAPDLAVFAAQGLLAGLALVAAWALARRCMPTAPLASWLSLALVSVLFVHPAVGRASVSESYLASGLSLGLVAAWMLSLGHLPRGGWQACFRALAPTVAGGLVLSLSVGIHPASWVPSASVPLVLLATPGSLRRRVKRTVVAFLVVGGVVLVTAGHGVWEVLHGELGQRWAHRPPVNTAALRPLLGVAIVTVLLAVLGSRRWRRAVVCALALFPLALAGPATDVITPSGARSYIASAFFWMHVPAALGLLASVLGSLPRRAAHTAVLAVLVACGGVLWSAVHFREHTVHPADDLEQRAFLRWREKLPAGATVAWLSRAENHILALPLYPATDPLGRRALPLTAGVAAASLPVGERAYWYRSSACSTEEAGAFCERVEGELLLEPVVTATFPGRWSLAHVPFDRERVHVGLYRIHGRR